MDLLLLNHLNIYQSDVKFSQGQRKEYFRVVQTPMFPLENTNGVWLTLEGGEIHRVVVLRIPRVKYRSPFRKPQWAHWTISPIPHVILNPIPPRISQYAHRSCNVNPLVLDPQMSVGSLPSFKFHVRNGCL